MAVSPLPLVLAYLGNGNGPPPHWKLAMAVIACLTCFVSALALFRRPFLGRWLGGLACLTSLVAVFPHASQSPFAALTSAIALILAGTTVIEPFDEGIKVRLQHPERCLERARWAALTVPLVVAMIMIMDTSNTALEGAVLACTSMIAQVLFLHWAVAKNFNRLILLPLGGVVAIGASLWFFSEIYTAGLALVISLFSLILLPKTHGIFEEETVWWDLLLDQPSRFLFTTFFSLCALGTLALTLPAASTAGTIEFVDAVFTSVSAVCVTGLIVLDTPHDFTLFGQSAILLLIQLGGLGIMSITTVALHAMGRRLSLKQERLLTTMTDTSHQDLVHSLRLILKFTFIVELIGALFLTGFFFLNGERLPEAAWRGVFTSVSAFCNAGFALQSDSLLAYQSNPLILQGVSVLIILGGLAPATSLAIPSWIRGKRIPIPARLALITTVTLLTAGTFCVLAFEWNGLLSGMNFVDKFQNAWFQSVTLRTAGFNSLDLAKATSPTILIMVVFMLIGGSPGGTAGGLKTTTIAILSMTFWSSIGNRTEVIVQKRRLHPTTISRAVTIVVSGGIVWFLVVLMLEITQQVPSGNLIFEATSAIGTVGLSLGATARLDEIGKVIIIVAMFVGRLGPVTMFMLLTEERAVTDTRYPVERVSIT